MLAAYLAAGLSHCFSSRALLVAFALALAIIAVPRRKFCVPDRPRDSVIFHSHRSAFKLDC